MINPESIFQSFDNSSFSEKKMPPVEVWNPEYCGEIDLEIKADGSWLYTGTPLTRVKMKQLFSRIIKKENEDYFLVTPVEKVAIKVEWHPFLIVDYQVINYQQKPTFQFIDNFGTSHLLLQQDQCQLSEFQQQALPIIHIRRNLFASFSRNCYYRLIDEAKIELHNQQNQVTIQSNGLTFCLGHYKSE